jgi:hypothetical protein
VAFSSLVHADGMLVAPGTTLLIALFGLALPAQPGDDRAPGGAIVLVTVTWAANQDLRLAAGAQEKPAGLFVYNTFAKTPV